jgi:hypothetical protein
MRNVSASADGIVGMGLAFGQVIGNTYVGLVPPIISAQA